MSAIKLALNPYEPNYKYIDDLTLMVHAPYRKMGMTSQSPPNLHDIIAEEPDEKRRTINLSFCDPHTQELEFTLDGNNTHAIHIKGRDYIITLEKIGEEEVTHEPGRKYLYVTFNIEQIG